MKMKSILSSLMLGSALLLSACGDTKSVDSSAKENNLEEFVIAYLPHESSDEKAELDEEFEKELEEELGVKVSSYQANSYNAAIEAMKNDKADLAFFGPFSYIFAAERAGAEALTTIDNAQQADKPLSIFVTAADSDINSLEDIKGKTMGFVDPVSTSGHLMPKKHLMDELGVTLEELETDGKFFKSVQFAGGHDKALIGAVNKQYDVAVVAKVKGDMLVDKQVVSEDSFKVIGEIPNLDAAGYGAFAIRGDHTDEMKNKVKQFLLSYDESYISKVTGFKGGELVEVDDSEFDAFREVAEALKMSPEDLLNQ
ncbi:phosphate/phosphite/phosphonate ABC transporter substrate-binding protein [Bacillus sp. FJAT-42315]|uniref:phosphate/phosphite/phosphonate ABC transporter substrate-binding protein n=1 Tax=Bacillus sp. FJAT-42315 TaxID=2014077 RepID=UPI000C240AAA|nr:phosphate/phosphite/phosphonate ABC transporter substrate-binding protein [Bacillus sp. FJAT-42315]